VTSDDFHSQINKKFKNYKSPKKKKSFKQMCYPQSYELQLPQKFLSKYINPDTIYKGILVFHQIGSGKTCTSIRIAEAWKEYRKIVVVVPASLIGNYRNELRSPCAGQNYLTNKERDLLKQYHPMSDEYTQIIRKSDERIDEYYTIYSYNKFVKLAEMGELNLRNSVLIIDEIQNMVSDDGKYYETLLSVINNSPKEMRVVLLSATPIFDKPLEIALTMNLLRLPKPFPTGIEFEHTFIETIKSRNGEIKYNAKNLDLFKDMVKGYVSYFRGADPASFPELKLYYSKCVMSDFQYRAYATVMGKEEREKKFKEYKKAIRLVRSGDIVNLPNNFFIGTRLVSNIAFPNNDIEESGMASMTKRKVLEHLDIYSTKFNKIMTKINRIHGKVFVYSAFRGFGGLESFIKILEAFGYKNCETYGEGKKRYGIFSGEENSEMKERVKAIYNRPENIYGDKLKVLLLSPAAKEGLSLYNVKQVHILEPYWNSSRIAQILGRAVRYCSHKALLPEERIVKAYIYIATHPNEKETVDEYIAKLAHRKSRLTQEFENALKETAVDCELFRNINHLGDLTCDN
jgi:SNF2 family DNA or RNA helicase